MRQQECLGYLTLGLTLLPQCFMEPLRLGWFRLTDHFAQQDAMFLSRIRLPKTVVVADPSLSHSQLACEHGPDARYGSFAGETESCTPQRRGEAVSRQGQRRRGTRN
jgi:hypothetical protein